MTWSQFVEAKSRRIRELEAANAELQRKAAAWDWCVANSDFFPVPFENGGWAIGVCSQAFETPLEAVEHVMKQEAP